MQEKKIKGTVPSLRLDAIMGVGFSCSRSKAAQYIKEGQIRVNGDKISDPSRNIKEEEIIEWEGHGEISLIEVGGETKKGRLRVSIKRVRKKED